MSALPDRLEAMISARALMPGDRLPAERTLAAQFGVSRSALREAIKHLASRGRVVSRQGGGTYVAAAQEGEPLRDALLELAPLARGEAGYWRDVLEIRKSLEADAAAFAARRADEADRARIAAACEVLSRALQSERGDSGAAEAPLGLARLDAAFHMAIARAAHNAVLHQVMIGLQGLLETSISDSLARLYRLPGVPGQLDLQHRRIMEAVLGADAEAARAAAIAHLCYVEDRLEDIESDAARQQRSAQALRHIRNTEDAPS